MSVARRFIGLTGLTLLLLQPAAIVAQERPAIDDELEPRIIGRSGTFTIGFAGFVDKLASSEDTFPWQATVQVDITRFVTSRVALRGGLIGSTSTRATSDDDTSDPSSPALHATAAGLYYFTPSAMLSLYAGGEYRARLTDRPSADAGALLGIVGTQATLSSRASFFVEGGYGFHLTRGDDDELRTRLGGIVGIRLRF